MAYPTSHVYTTESLVENTAAEPLWLACDTLGGMPQLAAIVSYFIEEKEVSCTCNGFWSDEKREIYKNDKKVINSCSYTFVT